MTWKHLKKWFPNYEEMYREVWGEKTEKNLKKLEEVEKAIKKKYYSYLGIIIMLVVIWLVWTYLSSSSSFKDIIQYLQMWSLIFAFLSTIFLGWGLWKNNSQIAIEVTTFPGINIYAAYSMISSRYAAGIGILLLALGILLSSLSIVFVDYIAKLV